MDPDTVLEPGADPDTRAPTRGEEGRYAAARAAVAAAPMPVSGGRPEAASTAAGAAGKPQTNEPLSYLYRGTAN